MTDNNTPNNIPPKDNNDESNNDHVVLNIETTPADTAAAATDSNTNNNSNSNVSFRLPTTASDTAAAAAASSNNDSSASSLLQPIKGSFNNNNNSSSFGFLTNSINNHSIKPLVHSRSYFLAENTMDDGAGGDAAAASSSSSINKDNNDTMILTTTIPVSDEDTTTSSTSTTAVITSTPPSPVPPSSQQQQQRRPPPYDDDVMLQSIMANVGQWAAGVVYIQLWVMNEHRNRLVQPSAGYWLDPIFHNCPNNCHHHHDNDDDVGTHVVECQLCKLVDKKDPNYIPAEPLPIGVGLAGVLWSRMAQHQHHSSHHQSGGSGSGSGSGGSGSFIKWYDLLDFANDPDQPWSPRLQHLANSCNFGKVASVPFHCLGEDGMIVCITRHTEQVNMERLISSTNESFLLSSAQLIGSTFVFRGPRREVVAERKAMLTASLQRARRRLLALRAFGVNLTELATNSLQQQQQQQGNNNKTDEGSGAFSSSNSWKKHDNNNKKHRSSFFQTSSSFKVHDLSNKNDSYLKIILYRIRDTFEKIQGGNVPSPPGFDTTEALWTFMGVFITLLLLTNLNRFFINGWGPERAFPLPPFGAFLTLLYGLTAAPASQPRNAIVGQTISISIAIVISYMDFMEPWLKQSLATSLAISIMVKLSITHPPAGAAAMIFSTNKNLGWSNLIFMIVANMFAIGSATLINNISTKRQYPTNWGLRTFMEWGIRNLNISINPPPPKKKK